MEVALSHECGTGVSPVSHAQDGRATIKIWTLSSEKSQNVASQFGLAVFLFAGTHLALAGDS